MSYNIPVGEVQISVTTTTQDVLKENPARRYAIIINDSDTAVYLSFGGDAQLNHGVRLNANGGSYEINSTNLWRGRVSAIASVASKVVTVVEW